MQPSLRSTVYFALAAFLPCLVTLVVLFQIQQTMIDPSYSNRLSATVVSGIQNPVHSVTEFVNAIANATPGSTIVIANGTYPDFVATVNKKGVQGNPILIKSESEGGVVLTGASRLYLTGSYIILSGLSFKNDSAATAIDITGNNNRVTGNQITNQSGQVYQAAITVQYSASDTEVDHNIFDNSTAMSVLVRGGNNSMPTGTHIYGNTFQNISLANGYIIQIVNTTDVTASMNTLVDSNVFKSVTAKALIAILSSGNKIQANTLSPNGKVIVYSGTGNSIDSAPNSSSTTPSTDIVTSTPVIPTVPTLPTSTKFIIGQKIQTADSVNVRTGAGGIIVGNQLIKTIGTIVGGPIIFESMSWWNVDYENNVDGWSSENFLQPYTAVATAPTVTFSISTTSVASGSSAMLTWTSTNATGCTASGAWSGTLLAQGTQSQANITSDKSFTLECTGAGGVVSKVVSIKVVTPGQSILVSNPDALTLTFGDEFNTGKFDDTKWNRGYVINKNTASGATYYTPDSIEVHNGALQLRADKRDFLDKHYTSGGITTFGSFAQRYGYYEARVKMPSGGQGFWPAFWLLPQSQGWPPEIDVFEYLSSRPNDFHTGSVYLSPTGHPAGPGNWVTPGIDLSKDYHTYGLAWRPDSMVYYFDNKEVARYTGAAVFQVPAYMILNLAVGGSWGGEPTAKTPFPSSMNVDYVHAYQYKDLSNVTFTPPVGAKGWDYIMNKPIVSSLFVKPGDTVTITTSGTAYRDLSTTYFKVIIHDFLGTKDFTTFLHTITPKNGTTQTFTDTWKVPNDLPDGVYTVGQSAYFNAESVNSYFGSAANITVSRTPVRTTATGGDAGSDAK